MSRIKDVTESVKIMGNVVTTMQKEQDTMKSDLYGSIKEVSELKYRIVELEARLSNLEAMVKMCVKEGV